VDVADGETGAMRMLLFGGTGDMRMLLFGGTGDEDAVVRWNW